MTRTEWIAALEREGWFVTEWTDEPGRHYEAHVHRAAEVRVVLEGSMTILIAGVAHVLHAGMRFDVEPDVTHEAIVGSDGAHYLSGAVRE